MLGLRASASTGDGDNCDFGVSEVGKNWITKFSSKFIDYINQFDNELTNPHNKKTVWRILRDDQLPTNPIVAKSNTGLTKSGTPYTIDGHVKNGGKTNTETPYLSSWTKKQAALDYALKDGGKTVIEIDLTTIGGKFIDLSDETVRNSLLTGTARNFAASSSEFLIIIDEIPINSFKVRNK
jgi:hypothetical protein